MQSFSLDAAQRDAYLRTFQEQGFLVLPGFYSAAEIDAASAKIDGFLNGADAPITVDHLLSERRAYWSYARRIAPREMFKFNDLYLFVEEVRQLALGARLSPILAALLGDKAVLCNSLNFAFGSQQPPHVDSLYMTPQTPDHLVASWIALEDVRSDAGPMAYYAGSHKIPRFHFSDGGRHAIADEMPRWQHYMTEQLAQRNLKEESFLARKGDVFIWHSELLHGGTRIQDTTKTRRSLVCHYYSEQDCRAMQLTLQSMNDNYWLDRLPHGVIATTGDFTQEDFPEHTYLSRHPDVAASVAAGHLASGYSHWQNHGVKEGRIV